MEALEVIAPGPCTTIQDRGRIGFQDVGLPRSGPLDRVSLRLANALVGNPPETSCLEMLLQGVSMKVLAPSIRVALVGCTAAMEIRSGEPFRVPPGRSVTVRRDDVIRIGALGDSVCAYLAIEGLDVPDVLGSASTYVRGGIGGINGRRLQPRDILAVKGDPAEDRAERMLSKSLDLQLDAPIRVVMGPQADHFTEQAIGTFLASEYIVTPQADRMGYRLQGPALAHKAGYDIVSDGIVSGAIQVPGSGQPIVLMIDNQTTGGYPKIATVISADLPVIGRRKPGRIVRFAAVDVQCAERLRREQETALASEISSIGTV